MQQISVETIQEAIQYVDSLSEENFEKEVENMAEQQPVLFEFAQMATQIGQQEHHVDMSGHLVYYWLLIASCFRLQNLQIAQIKNEDIEDSEEPFSLAITNYFATENEEVLHEFTGQYHLNLFILIELSTPDDDGTEIDDQLATLLFSTLLTFIHLLSKASYTA